MQVRTCVADPCYKVFCSGCNQGCVWLRSATGGVCVASAARTSVGTGSDAATLNTAAQITTDCPVDSPSTTTGSTSPPPREGGTDTISKLATAVSSGDRISTASSNIAKCLTSLQQNIDPVSGIVQGAQVSLVIVGVTAPGRNTDGTFSMTVTVTFIPQPGNSAGVTDDIRRVHEPCLVAFSNDLTGVTCDGTIKWNAGGKRAISQTSNSNSNTWGASTTMSGNSVQQAYGSSSTIFATLGLLLVSLIALFM